MWASCDRGRLFLHGGEVIGSGYVDLGGLFEERGPELREGDPYYSFAGKKKGRTLAASRTGSVPIAKRLTEGRIRFESTCCILEKFASISFFYLIFFHHKGISRRARWGKIIKMRMTVPEVSK